MTMNENDLPEELKGFLSTLKVLSLCLHHFKSDDETSDENSPIFNSEEISFIWLGALLAEVPRRHTQVQVVLMGGYIKNNEKLVRMVGRFKFTDKEYGVMKKEIVDFEFETTGDEKKDILEMYLKMQEIVKDSVVVPRFRVAEEFQAPIPKKVRGSAKKLKKFLDEECPILQATKK